MAESTRSAFANFMTFSEYGIKWNTACIRSLKVALRFRSDELRTLMSRSERTRFTATVFIFGFLKGRDCWQQVLFRRPATASSKVCLSQPGQSLPTIIDASTTGRSQGQRRVRFGRPDYTSISVHGGRHGCQTRRLPAFVRLSTTPLGSHFTPNCTRASLRITRPCERADSILKAQQREPGTTDADPANAVL